MISAHNHFRPLKSIPLCFIFSLAFALLNIVLIQNTFAATGEGAGTVGGGASQTVEISSSTVFTTVLTIGATGIATDADSPTFAIPAGFTAPHAAGGASVPTNAGEVNVAGEWFAVGAGGTCAITMGSSSATAQVITIDVTGACATTDTITLTYMGTAASTASAAAAIVIETDDAAAGGAKAAISSPPTIVVNGTSVLADHGTAGVATTNNLAGLAKIGGTDVVLGGFKVTAAGENVDLTTIRTTVTLGTMVIGELTNLRIVEDDGTGDGDPNDGIMHADELAAPLATIASPAEGNNDFTVVDTIAIGLENFFIVGTITATVSDADTIDVETTGAGSVAAGATSSVTITSTGTSANATRTITDTTAPTFTAARTALNTIVLTFDENVTSGGVDTDSFTVVGASAVSAGVVVGNTSITLTTTGLTATDGTPAVNYVAATGDVMDTSAATNEVADGGAIAAADQVAPVLLSAQTIDVGADGTTYNGKVDHLKLTFSENIDDSAIAGYLAATDYVATTLALATVTNEKVDAVEILGDAEDDTVLYIVFDEDAGDCTTTVFTGCDGATVDQDITWTGASVTIQDTAGNAAANLITGDVVEADTAAPYILGANYYDDSSNGTIDHLVVIFSEAVDDSSYADVSSTSSGGTLTTAALVAAATIPLDAAADDRWITLAIAGGTANTTSLTTPTLDTIATSMIKDIALNNSLDQNAVVMADKATPTAVSWSLDLQNKTLTLNFSESVDASTLAVGSIAVQNAAAQTESYTLTDSTTASSNGQTIVISLSNTDRLGAAGIAETQSSSYLALAATAINDLASNDVVAILSSAGLNATAFTSQTDSGSESSVTCVPPRIVAFSPNASVANLSEVFFDILPLQNSDIWSSFSQAKTAITITVGGEVIPSSNLTLTLGEYIRVTATLGTPITAAGNVSVSISAPSRTNEGLCYAEGSYTASVTGPVVSTPSSSSGGGGGSYNSAPKASSTTSTSTTTTPRALNTKRFTNIDSQKKIFNDVLPRAWERPFVDKVSAAGIMTGYADGSGKFGKNDEVTTAQLTKVGLESFGFDIPKTVTSAPFKDVEPDQWFAPYLLKAKKVNITPRVINDKVKPNQKISRGETLKLLVAFAGIDLSTVSEQSPFPDVPAGRRFTKSVVWATQNGIVNGYKDGNFGPYDSLTRGQLAKIVVNLIEFLEE